MNSELLKLKCPICHSPISIEKEWIVTCNTCRKELTVSWHNGNIVSIRRRIYPLDHYLNGTESEFLQTFIEYIEDNFSFENWGFTKSIRFPKERTVIYDSEFCRIKFILGASDYGPVYATSIFYGRRHAPDNQLRYMQWNHENCLCWHSNILGLTVPFIEGISPRQLAENSGEIWRSLEQDLNVEFPSDYIEYPLRLHARIWERYGEKLFSIFDIREPEIWEEYSKYSNEYNEAHHKKWKISGAIEKIC